MDRKESGRGIEHFLQWPAPVELIGQPIKRPGQLGTVALLAGRPQPRRQRQFGGAQLGHVVNQLAGLLDRENLLRNLRGGAAGLDDFENAKTLVGEPPARIGDRCGVDVAVDPLAV